MTAPDLVAYLPCPIKVPFEQAIHQYLEETGTASSISLQIEGNANKSEADYARLIEAQAAEQLPPLLITPGVNQLYAKAFIDGVLDSGAYEDVAPYVRDESRRETQLRDPKGSATVLAANITLMVVDHKHLGDRKMPESWDDLLLPEFAGSVIMRGNGKTFCETTLLAWHSLFGNTGLASMGRSIREGWHPAQMVKVAGTGHERGAAVYVMPYFFARNIRTKDGVTMVWPREGTIASPVTLLAKRRLPPQLRSFAQWLAGPVIARLFTIAGLPTPHPQVPSGVPEDVGYVWSGWDNARSLDLAAELSAAEGAFASGHLKPV